MNFQDYYDLCTPPAGSTTFFRPYLSEKDPRNSGKDIKRWFIVGINPATPIDANDLAPSQDPQHAYASLGWDSGKYHSFLELYARKRVQAGKGVVSKTRSAINWLKGWIEARTPSAIVVETNVLPFPASSPDGVQAAGALPQAQQIFQTVYQTLQPHAMIVHGKDAYKGLVNLNNNLPPPGNGGWAAQVQALINCNPPLKFTLNGHTCDLYVIDHLGPLRFNINTPGKCALLGKIP